MIPIVLSILLASGLPTVAVNDLGGPAIDAEVRAVLSAQVRSAMHRAGTHTVVADEAMAALDEALVKRLADGCDSDECLAALSGSVQADLLLLGRVGRVGGKVSLTLKLVHIAKRTTEASASRHLDGAIEDLLPVIDGAVADLCGLEKGLPIEEVDGLALLPLELPEGFGEDERSALSAEAATAADRSRRFRALYSGKRLLSRLGSKLKSGLKKCVSEECMGAIGKAVKLPFAARVWAAKAGKGYQVSAVLIATDENKRTALETQRIPDAASLAVGVRTVLNAAIARTFDPRAPQLHKEMKVSVVAGADPLLRAKRTRWFRYAGTVIGVSGVAAFGVGYLQTSDAATQLADPSVQADRNAFSREWTSANQGTTLQWIGVATVASGVALLGLGMLQ
jgi:hypothetical protein